MARTRPNHFCALVLLLLVQCNEVTAKGPLNILTLGKEVGSEDANPTHHMSLAVHHALNGADQGLLVTSEAQYADLSLGDLASAEAADTDTAMNMTTLTASQVVSKMKGAPAVIKSLFGQHYIVEQVAGEDQIQKGVDMLNAMIQETLEKLDLERQTCATFIKTQTHQIWLTNQAIRKYDANLAGAREDILASQTSIGQLATLLPALQTTVEAHTIRCTDDISGLEAELKIVLGDLAVLASVLKMTSCKESLLQHVLLRTQIESIHSTEARQSLAGDLDEACTDVIPLEKPKSLVQTFQEPGVKPSTDGGKPPGVSGTDKQRMKCTLSKSSCSRVRDKFLRIGADVMANRDKLMAELEAMKKHCHVETENLDSQIADSETDLKGQQTALAKSTKEQNDAERNSKLKNEERVGLMAENLRMTNLCKVNIGALVTDKCALGKIRGELEAMSGKKDKNFIQDCEVTDWASEECSVTCGGGVQKETRAVSVHPHGGAECPPLEMERKCNEQKCPIDCELDDWSEWSACTAECNGGLKQKVRNVKAQTEHGGIPCGDTSMAESCNVQSCDIPCTLTDWTTWSQCSKQCNDGLMTRKKNVLEKAQGTGECAGRDADTRLEFKTCNEAPCRGNITCETALDVVVLLDGSSGVGEANFGLLKKAGERFVSAFNGKLVEVSIILYSGPSTFELMDQCTGASGSKGPPPKLKEDCGIDIAQHFTSDMKKAAGVIKGLEWPGKSTLISQALMTAKAETALGRKDASTVVIVFGYGKAMNAKRTRETAQTLRQAGRLMWVQVNNDNVKMKDVTSWASVPKSDNVIEVSDFETLADHETINEIIADMCPEVGEEPLESDVLEYLGKKPTVSLGLCQGDCDNDSDCQSGLKCFQRKDKESCSVPGCSGTCNSKKTDYCVSA